MLRRQGFTLVELLVALVLTSIVMGAATLSLLRQQRTGLRISAVAEADRQLSAATTLLAEQLSVLESNDLANGELRDTAIQLRAPVALSAACTSGRGTVTLLPDTGSDRITGSASDPRPGDTLWWNADSAWHSAEITAAASSGTINCPAPLLLAGKSTRISVAGIDSIPAGATLRVTRLLRYSLYKSGDGTWQLGIRESSGGQFPSPQPVAGPFVRQLGAAHTGFRFLDAAGADLGSGPQGIDPTRLTRVRFTAVALLRTRERGQDSVRADSIDIAISRSGVP